MGTHIIDSLIVLFSLDTKGFKDGEREVQDGTRRLRDESKRSFDSMEQAGKKVGETIKGVSREVIGLGLAFMGAKSIVGFVANMATGAASADRFGQTLGMTTQKVWAWRQAMKSVGGELNEGDAALQAIQGAKSAFRQGRLDPQQAGIYGRLGITGNDLRTASAGDILQKLAGASDRMDPQLYSSLLGQIGLPQSAIYFLMKGQEKADALLKEFEGSADSAEELAKQSEDLQKEMAALNTQVQQALLPVLRDIVPLLTDLVSYLGELAGHKENAANAAKGAISGAAGGFIMGGPWGAVAGAMLGGAVGYNLPTGGTGAATPGSWADQANRSVDRFIAGGGSRHDQVVAFLTGRGATPQQALGIAGALYAESRLDPNARNPTSGAFGIGQWLGDRRDGLFRRFGPHPSLMQQLEYLWWELSGGDHGGRAVMAQHDAHSTAGAMIRRFLRPAQGYETLRDMSAAGRYIANHRSSAVTINGGVHVSTNATNGHQIARDVHAGLRRRMQVAQADPVVRP